VIDVQNDKKGGEEKRREEKRRVEGKRKKPAVRPIVFIESLKPRNNSRRTRNE